MTLVLVMLACNCTYFFQTLPVIQVSVVKLLLLPILSYTLGCLLSVHFEWSTVTTEYLYHVTNEMGTIYLLFYPKGFLFDSLCTYIN